MSALGKVRRIASILTASPEKQALRVSVEGGGCSGFSYKFDLVEDQQDDDMVLECAVASGSRYLLTHNVKDFSGTRTLGVHAMTPADFLRLMD